MTQPTLAASRVINPILTEVARGYKQPGMWARRALFPTVPVGQRAGTIITFTPEDFQLYATRRAPGANTMRVQFGRGTGSYALVDHSLEGTVPIEVQQESMAVPGLDESARAIAQVQAVMELGMEKEAADIARTAATYPVGNKTALSGGSLWSATSSTPIADVEAAREAIRSKVGRYPNVIVIPPKVMTALKQHASIIDRMKYTGRDLPTLELIGSFFEVPNVIVPDSIYLADNADLAAPAFSDVWGTDVILAYVETAGLASRGSPSFGYTYQLDGHPFAEDPYYGRNEKTWYFPFTDARQPVLAGPTAGYLIQTAV